MPCIRFLEYSTYSSRLLYHNMIMSSAVSTYKQFCNKEFLVGSPKQLWQKKKKNASCKNTAYVKCNKILNSWLVPLRHHNYRKEGRAWDRLCKNAILILQERKKKKIATGSFTYSVILRAQKPQKAQCRWHRNKNY